MKKKCTNCKLEKDISEFGINKSVKDGHQDWCKKCMSNFQKNRRLNPIVRKKEKESHKRYIDKHSKKMWAYHLKRTYGITLENYNQMLIQQGNRCAICSIEFNNTKSDTKCCVDHNHITNKVRGLICKKCNIGLSRFNDNTTILINAIKYLEKS